MTTDRQRSSEQDEARRLRDALAQITTKVSWSEPPAHAVDEGFACPCDIWGESDIAIAVRLERDDDSVSDHVTRLRQWLEQHPGTLVGQLPLAAVQKVIVQVFWPEYQDRLFERRQFAESQGQLIMMGVPDVTYASMQLDRPIAQQDDDALLATATAIVTKIAAAVTGVTPSGLGPGMGPAQMAALAQAMGQGMGATMTGGEAPGPAEEDVFDLPGDDPELRQWRRRRMGPGGHGGGQ